MGALIHTKKVLLTAIFFPILVLASLAAYKAYVLSLGVERIFPISGYDPRDLLSGHFLIYRIDYGIAESCAEVIPELAGFLCLEPKAFHSSQPEACPTFIRGVCKNGRFEAGIEKFFIPEDQAKQLERQIQSQPASILIAIPANGRAQVKDLLINGKSWSTQ